MAKRTKKPPITGEQLAKAANNLAIDIKPKGTAFQHMKMPFTDGSGYEMPVMSSDLTFRDAGSYGLRQYSGYTREEFLRALQGREAARTYREMGDNSAIVGAVLFAVIQLMRKVTWRVNPVSDKPEAQQEAEFVESLMEDMSHTWDDFMVESLSMLRFGYSIHEIVYKRRMGQKPTPTADDPDPPRSRFNDGRIGIRRLPIRGQETVLRWFMDPNGQIRGVRQQPWVGPLIDIPIEKMLLFRPMQHKNNPEGFSILRTAYRSYYFLKRMEEQEAIMYERFSGFPVLSVPSALLLAAANGDANAKAAVDTYKNIITNVRVDEQMGLLKPSDHYQNEDGSFSQAEMFKFELVTPTATRATNTITTAIDRYKMDILTSVLADFVALGHSSGMRGAQALGITKVDIFYQAIEGWLNSIAEVLNRHLLPRIWLLNNLDMDLMPQLVPDMAQRVDLDALGNFILHLSQAGMSMFPDFDLENYIRDASGLPNILEEEWEKRQQEAQAANAMQSGGSSSPPNEGNTGVETALSPKTTNSPTGVRSQGPNPKQPTVHQPNTHAISGTNGNIASRPRVGKPSFNRNRLKKGRVF